MRNPISFILTEFWYHSELVLVFAGDIFVVLSSKWLCSFYHVIFLLGIYLFLLYFFGHEIKIVVVVVVVVVILFKFFPYSHLYSQCIRYMYIGRRSE